MNCLIIAVLFCVLPGSTNLVASICHENRRCTTIRYKTSTTMAPGAPRAAYRRQYSKSTIVKDKDYDLFVSSCNDELNRLGLQPLQRPNPLLGSRPLHKKSVERYTTHCRRFVEFALKEGWKESLLPFYPYTPKGTVTIEKDAMVAFLYAMYTKKGDPVVDLHNTPITNMSGTSHILGRGLWHDPDNCDGLRSAITHVLVNSHGLGDSYWDKCHQCVEAVREQNFLGCPFHNPPRVVTTGNVMTCTQVNDTIHWLRDNTDHVVQGASHLLPSHVRQIRAYAEASNDVYWFGIYTLLLMSIELFLRKMEFSSLTLDNFNTDMFVMSAENLPEALNLRVKGKKKEEEKERA